jgi:hypothetical protein
MRTPHFRTSYRRGVKPQPTGPYHPKQLPGKPPDITDEPPAKLASPPA